MVPFRHSSAVCLVQGVLVLDSQDHQRMKLKGTMLVTEQGLRCWSCFKVET